MTYKKYLLPHSWHIAGLIIAAIGIILVTFGLIDSSSLKSFYIFCGYCASYFGLTIAALSREKVEDEFIAHLRLRTVVWTVLAGMFINIALEVGYMTIAPYYLATWGAVSMWVMPLHHAPVWILIYLVIFKISLFNYTRNEQ